VAGVHTTQRNESLNSLIKGGTVFATTLMDMSFYQADCFLVDLQDKFLEQALDELTELLRQHKDYCPKIRAILHAAVTGAVDNCCGKNGWSVVPEENGEYVVTECSGRKHTVVFDSTSASKPVSCSCHEFTRMEVTCLGIAAVLKSQGKDPYDMQWLPQQWRLSYHPIWATAMQRMCPMPPSEDHAVGAISEIEQHDPAQMQQAVVTRWAKVSAIPTPSTANLRRAQMQDAFNSLRDDFSVPECPDKYRSVMAMIFDCRAMFRGTPGQWLQDPPAPTKGTITSWRGDGLAPPPPNMANCARGAGVGATRTLSQSDMTVRDARKKRKSGAFPTVGDRRQESGDWTLYWPTNSDDTFMCPIPGCMKKPIKNSDQSRYHHRQSAKHKQGLVQHPTKPPDTATDGTGTASAADNVRVSDATADTGIPASAADNVRVSDATADTGIPASSADIVHVSDATSEGAATAPVPPAFYLPQHPEFAQFKINQFCTTGCTYWELCSVHQAMLPAALSATSASGNDVLDGILPPPPSIPSQAAAAATAPAPRRSSRRAREPSPEEFQISDSMHTAVFGSDLPAAPEKDDNSAAARQQRQARAKELSRRAMEHRFSLPWRVVSCSLPAFPVLNGIASDVLPYMTDAGMEHLKVNHSCKTCTDRRLCASHEKMRVPVADHTIRHMACMSAANRFLVECGGDGNCFYHSVLGLAMLFLPALYHEWGDGNVDVLRKKVCKSLQTNWADIRCALFDVDDGSETHSVPIVELLRGRTSNKNRADQAIVNSFATANARQGVFVEGEIVQSFAHFCRMPVIVTHRQSTGVHIVSPDGRPMRLSDPRVVNSPFHIYCTDGHYQAVVPLAKVQIRTERDVRDLHGLELCHVRPIEVLEVD
jgi:hypothetical protein